MTWLEYHTASSRAAAEGEAAARASATERALSLYRQAAEAEEKALSALDPAKRRTLGITAVSAVALWCKGGDLDRAKQLADRLAGEDLPSFATRQIGEILKPFATESERQHQERDAPLPAQAGFRATPLTDHEVVVLAQKGSEKAFREILGRYQRPVFSLIHRMVRNREQAEDLAQETFVRVFNNIDRYDPAYKFSSWVFKLATNLTIDWIRRKEPPVGSIDTLELADSSDKPHVGHSVFASLAREELGSESERLKVIRAMVQRHQEALHETGA